MAEPYQDERGRIDPDVHDAAGKLRQRAARYALEVLRDEHAGLRLLMHAAANVTRARDASRDPAAIRHLRAYLWQAYRGLVLDELEKAHRHGELLVTRARDLAPSGHEPNDPDQRILLDQVKARMDPWTRMVFEARQLGADYHTIGQELGKDPHVVRNRFNARVKRLKKMLAQGGR